MAEFPSLPLWTDAYLGDTTHLTTIEHGAYLLLLMTAWRSRETRLPDDDKLLARYTRLGPAQWRRIKPVIADFFCIENGYWTQRRLNDEAIAVKQFRERQRKAGKASALKRKGRHSTTVEPEANQNQPPTPTPTPKVISTKVDSPSGDELKPEHIHEEFNVMAEKLGLPKAIKLNAGRRQLLKHRAKQNTVDDFATVFGNIEASPFLRGDKGTTPCKFDWLFKNQNFTKVLEGNYND